MRRRGFTLLEVMVALAILAAGLMAIADLSGNALRNHAYARDLSLATLLARGKLAELEEGWQDSGFRDFDEEKDGDFADEGHPEFKWRAELTRPDPHLSSDQLFGMLAGLGGDASTQDVLAKLMGGTTPSGGGPQVTAGAAGAAMATTLQAQIDAFAEQVKKALRHLTLTVAWRDGRQVREMTVSTHLVVLNPRAPGGQRGQDPDVPPGLVAPGAAIPGATLPGTTLPGTTVPGGATSPGATLPKKGG